MLDKSFHFVCFFQKEIVHCRIQKDPSPERYGEVEGDGQYATKMQLQFLNYALVSSFSQIQNNQFRPQF